MLLKDWIKEYIPDNWDLETTHTDCPDGTYIVVFSDPNQVQAYVVWVRPVKALTGQIQNVVDCVIDGKYKMVFGEEVLSSGE